MFPVKILFNAIPALTGLISSPALNKSERLTGTTHSVSWYLPWNPVCESFRFLISYFWQQQCSMCVLGVSVMTGPAKGLWTSSRTKGPCSFRCPAAQGYPSAPELCSSHTPKPWSCFQLDLNVDRILAAASSVCSAGKLKNVGPLMMVHLSSKRLLHFWPCWAFFVSILKV